MIQSAHRNSSGTPSLADQVAEGVARMIMEQGMSPGDSLPPESALSAQFGVSKPVVREGLSQLVGLGVVESRKGSAATVKRVDGEPLRAYFSFSVRQDAAGMRQAFELRRVLEVHVVGVAATQITEAQIGALRRCVGHLYVTRDLDREWAEADVEFHRQILAIAENATMGRILEALEGAVGETVRNVRYHHHPEDTLASFRRHEAVFEALARRDVAGSRAAMQAHFDAIDLVLENISARFEAEMQERKK